MKLFNQLQHLVDTNTAFSAKDTTLTTGQVMRIFDYRLPSWTDFQSPGALDMRGTMFDVTDINEPRLVCLPPQKFFNYEEGNVPHHTAKVGVIMDKRDGSLISSYCDGDGTLRLKTRGAVDSDQSTDASKWLTDQPILKEWMLRAEHAGYTVNLEWTSPLNRIVLAYSQPEMRVLSIRHRETGVTLAPDRITDLPKHYMVEYTTEVISPEDVNKRAFQLTVGEGYVVELKLGDISYFVKCKSEKYQLMHKNKDSICNPRALYELVTKGQSDDMKSLLAHDPVALDLINRMEQYLFPIYNHICAVMDTWFQEHHTLDRKSFAFKCKQHHPHLTPLLMLKYVGKPYDVKSFMATKYDLYKPRDLLAGA